MVKYIGDPNRWVEFLSEWARFRGIEFFDINARSSVPVNKFPKLPKSCLDFYVATNMIGWNNFKKMEFYYDMNFKKIDEIDLYILSPVMSNLSFFGEGSTVPMLMRGRRCVDYNERERIDALLAASYLVAEDEDQMSSLVINPLVFDEEGEWETTYSNSYTFKSLDFPSFAHALAWIYMVDVGISDGSCWLDCRDDSSGASFVLFDVN